MFSKDGNNKDIKTPRIVDVVWHNGEFIDWKDARVHVMSHVLHYGSSIFEGIRCYSTKQGPAVFRLREHMQRFLNSAKIYRMDHPWTLDELCTAAIEIVKRSGMNQCYLRPIFFAVLTKNIRRLASIHFRTRWHAISAHGTGVSISATKRSSGAWTFVFLRGTV